MIARLFAKRIPWRIEFSNETIGIAGYVYEFGPYIIRAEANGYRETITVERDGKKRVVYSDVPMIGGTIDFAKRRAEVWLHKNNDVLMRSYL